MQKNRDENDADNSTNSPGKLTEALAITKELNGLDVTAENSQILVMKGRRESFEVCSSYRIGVKRDMPQDSRFYIKANRFVPISPQQITLKNALLK